jgi:hypothetical protein
MSIFFFDLPGQNGNICTSWQDYRRIRVDKNQNLTLEGDARSLWAVCL